jgi:Sulfotransferase family
MRNPMNAASPTGLPSFIVFGAIKAATTWIQVQLQSNPGIYMPDPEPHFFSSEFERGEDFYRSFFKDAAAGSLLGEKSADYLAHPLAAQRIAALLPHVRLVVQFRNPVDRAYSDYKMLYRRGTVRGKPEDYLSSFDNPQPRFLHDGLYAEHLRRWLDHFPPEQILAFLYDDVQADPRGTVAKVSAHIGVEPIFDAERAKRRENDSAETFLPLPIRAALAPLKNSVKPLRSLSWFQATRGLIARPIAYPPLEMELRERMGELYARDVEQLGSLIGRDLSNWLTIPMTEMAS